MGEHDRKGDRLKCCLHKDGAKRDVNIWMVSLVIRFMGSVGGQGAEK